jgi:STE24 endopeptidase
MIATRIPTVSRVSGRHGLPVLAPALVAAGAAELARRLLTPRAAVPAPVAVDLHDHFSALEIARGRAFSRPQARIGAARSALETALLVATVRRASRLPARSRAHPVAEAAASSAALSLALAAPGLPLRALARRRALRAGLATQSWAGWAGDLAKAAAIQTVMSAGLGGGVIALSRRSPQRWWIPVAGATVAAAALAGALAPVLLEPIFNDFEPLPAGETRDDVLALAGAAGVSVGEVYSVDASRRTTAANAYVSGLGPTKRVVLYDTMLDRYSRDEIRLVVAHELGHVRHRDVARNLAFVALVAPVVVWATQRVGAALAANDPGEPLTAAALPALGLAAGLVSLPLGPPAARMSRAMERRADHFSLTLAGAPEAFISFERGAAVQNLTDLQPRWLARQLASHPPAAERIGAALAFAFAESGS